MEAMPSIELFELGPTRSARVRWILLEAALPYESVGNSVEVGSDELRSIHPLGKLPAVIIDGKPLFESAAIVTAIADLVPEKDLIAISIINGSVSPSRRWSLTSIAPRSIQ
jgi:glutathione S-transferase